MISSYFYKVKEFCAQRYHQHVRVDGEKAMDTLIGTMLGVLFLAIISSSFAGIFMAYTVSTNKAAENTDRTSLATKHSTNTLNNLFIDSVRNGKANAETPVNGVTDQTMDEELKESQQKTGKPSTTAEIAQWKNNWNYQWGWNEWTVKSHNKALSATSGLNPNVAFKDYTFAATRPMIRSEDVNNNGTLDAGEDINGNGIINTGEDKNSNGALDAGEDTNGNGVLDVSRIFISQWGQVKDGIVNTYTSVPKAGLTYKTSTGAEGKCDWTALPTDLDKFCITLMDSVQSVVAPPWGVRDETKLRWADYVTQYSWSGNAADWTSDTRNSVITSKLGVVTVPKATDTARTYKWVAMFDDLTPGKKVSIEFVEDTKGTIYSDSFTPTLEEGESGKVTRSAHGTLALPVDATSVTVYLDTDVSAPTTSDQTVKLYRFMIYNMK